MSTEHKGLAAGRWFELSLMEQMANVGSEMERALNWRARNNADYCDKAFFRMLELIDLTLEDSKNKHRLKELARTREAAVDFFKNGNEYRSTEDSWRAYFLSFTYAARRNR